MRPLSSSRRAATALLWTWFAVFLAAPASWRPCPMHVPAREAGTMGVDTHPSAQMGAHAGAHVGTHAGAHSATTRHGGDDREGADAHPCDCATNCCGTSPTALEAPGIGRAASAPPATQPPILASAPGIASARVRLLPFANAPPSA